MARQTAETAKNTDGDKQPELAVQEQLPDVATPKQTAKFVGSTVQALAQDRYLGRGLPYVRYGGRIRYLRQDVLDHLAANRVRPEPPVAEPVRSLRGP